MKSKVSNFTHFQVDLSARTLMFSVLMSHDYIKTGDILRENIFMYCFLLRVSDRDTLPILFMGNTGKGKTIKSQW